MKSIAEFFFDLLNVIDRYKIQDYDANDAIAFLQGVRSGAGEDSNNPYNPTQIRWSFWKQGYDAAKLDKTARYGNE